MNFHADDYCVRPPKAHLVPGSVFLHVPIVFTASERLPALALSPDGTYRHQDFSTGWRSAPQARRDEGLPVLVRAKARPVLVLRVGAAVMDQTYYRSVWVAPIYGVRDPPRRGPNIFPLPAWPEQGLLYSGCADLYAATMVPLQHIQAGTYGGR